MMRPKLSLAALAAVALTQTACQAQSGGFKKSPDGLQYKIVDDKPGRNANLGDFMDLHLVTKFNDGKKDSVLFDTRTVNNGQPVPVPVQRPGFPGDLMAGLTYLSQGDSAVIKVPLDSMLKLGAQKLPGMQEGKGQTIDYYVRVARLRTAAEVQKDQQEQATKQNSVDDKLIQDYLAANGIKAMKTPSGIYYKIDNPGSGAPLKTGNNVTMNYTGKLLNGNKFDSNVDPAFNHVEPFKFMLGQGQVIRGWDEGIPMFRKGGKGTLYIPSPLAYGAQSPSPAIPANSVLVFDVEVVDAETGNAMPEPSPAPMQMKMEPAKIPAPKKKK